MSEALVFVFIRHRFASLFASIAAYAAVVLAFGQALEVSANYFVILPLAVVAVGYGIRGGLAVGALALPANLLLFRILGHPEFSPASKLIAELSGLGVGLVVGRLADYFRELQEEIRRRKVSEEELRKALADKELLLRELSHRVKNNLSVIKSIAQLQRSRSSDPDFIASTDALISRIFAISLVHEQLDKDRGIEAVDPAEYVAAIVENIESGLLGLSRGSVGLELETEGRLLQTEAATSLGLIVNEAITNACKHAAPGREGKPSVRLSLRVEGGSYRLRIDDDGPGPGTAGEGSGLGLKLVAALARNLGGTASLGPLVEIDAEGREAVVGSRFELVFPETLMEYLSSGKGAGYSAPM